MVPEAGPAFSQKRPTNIEIDADFENNQLYNLQGFEDRQLNFMIWDIAGQKFFIPLKTGEIIVAEGQWWDDVAPDYQELLVPASIGTPEGLSKCYVFCGGILVDPQILQQIEGIDPSNNYHKYDSYNHIH